MNDEKDNLYVKNTNGYDSLLQLCSLMKRGQWLQAMKISLLKSHTIFHYK